MAIRLPRMLRICLSVSSSRSCPSKTIWPAAIFPGGSGISRMIDNALTVLPQPLSPTSATVRPGGTDQLTPSTARTKPSSVSKCVHRSSTSKSPSSVEARMFSLLAA